MNDSARKQRSNAQTDVNHVRKRGGQTVRRARKKMGV
jgi:hypothetical protein